MGILIRLSWLQSLKSWSLRQTRGGSHRGYAHAHKGDYDSAISDYNKAIELSPKFAVAYNHRGYAYVHKRDKGHAIADFRKALSLDPNLSNAREGLRRFGLTY